jgi:membrane protein
VATAGPAPTLKLRLADRWARLAYIYQREIWQSAYLKDRSLKGRCFAVMRVVSITATVLFESRIASRAAALSYSSLLGLGPLIAIAVLVAGFALGGKTNDPNLVANTLSRLIKVVAPQIQQYEVLTQTPTEVNPQLVEIINNIIGISKSGSAGTLSVFSLLIVVLLLFKAIEDTFNDIWGVRQGRSVMLRIVLYWTVLTLGAVLFFTAVTLLGASTFGAVFMEDLPDGPGLLASLSWTVPFSVLLLTITLTVFYRVIPNTRVFWSAALVGGLVVAAMLVANNFMQFLYVKQVVRERSLYGSLAILPVLMFGLYIFWLCVLIGGVVSYAIQNVHFRNSRAAWATLTETMRERLALVVFLTICRRFRECLPPISASQLSEMLKVPTQLLNECMNRLVQLQLVTVVQPPANADSNEGLFQPGRPLNRMTLFDFKTLDDNLGEDPIGNSLERIDPLLADYDVGLRRLGEQDFFKKTIEELLAEHPFEESRVLTNPRDQNTPKPADDATAKPPAA